MGTRGMMDNIEKWFNDEVTYVSGHRDVPRPFNFHLVSFKRTKVKKVFVNGRGFIGTSKSFWKKYGNPDIVINGDEGHYENKKKAVLPKGLGVSNGTIYKWKSEETCVQWDDQHRLLGISDKLLPGVYNACGGSNRLLENGVIPEWIKKKPSVDPRTSLFWNDEYYFIIMIDGRSDGTLGLRLDELAEFALSWGAKDGQNFDGGDSCQLLFNLFGIPLIKNNLPDEKLHGVVNHVGFWIDQDGENGDIVIGEPMYNCAVLLNTDERVAPSIAAAKTGLTLLPGTSWETDYYFEVSELEAWVKTPSGNYTAQRYPRPDSTSPKVYVSVTNIAPPAPELRVKSIQVTYEDNSTDELVPKVS